LWREPHRDLASDFVLQIEDFADADTRALAPNHRARMRVAKLHRDAVSSGHAAHSPEKCVTHAEGTADFSWVRLAPTEDRARGRGNDEQLVQAGERHAHILG